MATYNTLTSLLTAIANAIRSKTGETGVINAQDFPSKINNLNSLHVYYNEKAISDSPTFSIPLDTPPKYFYIYYKEKIDYCSALLYNPSVNANPCAFRHYNNTYSFSDAYYKYENKMAKFTLNGFDAGTLCITIFY